MNNCFSIIFRVKYQELKKNGLKHKNTDAIVHAHARVQLLQVVLKIIKACTLIVNQFTHRGSAVKQTSETLRKIDSSRYLVLSISL